jgi:hypothetical protein
MDDGQRLDFNARFAFREFEDWAQDEELTRRLDGCLAIQRAIEPELLRTHFEPVADAAERVSPAALERLLQADRDVRSIHKKKNEIANCIVFGSSRDVGGSIRNNAVRRQMRRVDALVSAKVRRLFRSDHAIHAERVGHFWYPPGSYMGWHTNSNSPGWRMYVVYCEEPGKSFFRYRDPDTHEIVTSYDQRWTVRLFRVTTDNLLWHSIYSDTNRYSFGYRIVRKPSPVQRIVNKLGRSWRDVLAGHMPRLRDV